MHQPNAQQGMIDRLHQRGFNAIYQRSLLYNTCWEDPALDREAMSLTANDRMVMITSAGCNALDYAIDGPAQIDCVDANPRQNALLEFKLAGIRALDHDTFFRLFGHGCMRDLRSVYLDALRPLLSRDARSFWDSRLHWWNGEGWRNSFYFYGLSGFVARGFRTLLRHRPKLARAVRELLDAEQIEDQRRLFYDQVAPRLFGPSIRWLLGRQMTMNMLGVPREQGREVQASHRNGIAGFIESCLEAVCCHQPFQENYFWRVYLTGSYSPTCCPRYLTPAGFAALKAGGVERIHTHTTTVTDHLKRRDPQSVSKFVLLDHMDWMGSAHPQALAEEWREVFRVATPDSQVLFRSGSHHPGFIDSLQPFADGRALGDLLTFDRATAARLHPLDRVHTYASFHIAHPRVQAVAC